MVVLPLSQHQIDGAKQSYTTRHVNKQACAALLSGDGIPRIGDLVLARVSDISQHKRIELSNGRRSLLFPGDEVILCYGNRYAPDQFEAEIPLDLSPCQLVAAGGIAGRVISQHASMDPATSLDIVGLLLNHQLRPINLRDWALSVPQPLSSSSSRPVTLAVLGSSMNAGKTTTVAHLVHSLSQAGYRVGSAKVTGTGAGGDIWKMWDAGAKIALDFTDAGYPSTYKVPAVEIEGILSSLMAQLAAADVDVIVLEVADGLYQAETAAIVTSDLFRSLVDGILFAAGGSLGAVAGVQWLLRHNLSILGISGLVTASPLAARETAIATGLPVFDLEALHHEAPGMVARLIQAPKVGSLV
ncbi:MAG: DUF1611 domain-containing protein [Synechococcaceae cyanobacterium SM2_3_2]|nr:DUF1611 domain-containing protein [Synechococcaceae cyanobacterium SM2_3_2]